MSKIGDYVKDLIKNRLGNVKNVTADNIKEKPETNTGVTQDKNGTPLIGQQGIVDDPYFEFSNRNNIYKAKASRLTPKMLKEVSLRDWLVSAIIQTRVNTLDQFSRTQNSKFEPGFKFLKKSKDQEYTEDEAKEIKSLESFILNCGRIENTPREDRLTFSNFLKMISRDALTFGHVAIEKVLTRKGALHRFRPLPAETVFLIDKRATKNQIIQTANMVKQRIRVGDNDPQKKWQVNKPDVDFYKYVQISLDNQPLAVFGDEDMIFKLFNVQNFADSLGYSYGPLELAVGNVITHMKVATYNSNFFTHGYAARGILHIHGSTTDQKIKEFKRLFYNAINGSGNAWRTPIFAGSHDLKWVPMTGTAREMEYINFNNHIMRILCAQFQIDPVELGLDYLVTNSNRGTSANTGTKEKITYSKERGLLPLLRFTEDIINHDIIPAIDLELAKKYTFSFSGYTDDTPALEINRSQAEMSIYMSMNDLLKRYDKPTIKDEIANLPLNKFFWELVEKNYTRAEIREKFLGDKKAKNQKQLHYIPGDPAWLQWQRITMELQNNRNNQKMQEKEQEMTEKQAEEEKAQQEAQMQGMPGEEGGDEGGILEAMKSATDENKEE
jgi:hypothetical protein